MIKAKKYLEKNPKQVDKAIEIAYIEGQLAECGPANKAFNLRETLAKLLDGQD